MNDKKSIDSRIVEADEDAVFKASDALSYGELVALPTETVYGLAAVATNGKAVARIFEAKGRPTFNPLICHVASRDMAKNIVETCEISEKLMSAFWPGPLTLVLPQKPDNGISDLVSAGLDTLAVRLPANRLTREIIEKLGKPIAAPSANKSGKISPTSAAHVMDDMQGSIALIVDDGPASHGIESTIASVIDGEITLLRPGSITASDIEATTGKPVKTQDSDDIIAPGMMTSHYAPDKPVTLNVSSVDDDSFMIGFGEIEGDLTLSAAGDLREAAANLFAALRQANQSDEAAIAVAPIPYVGLGLAINDRLSRAAAPKD